MVFQEEYKMKKDYANKTYIRKPTKKGILKAIVGAGAIIGTIMWGGNRDYQTEQEWNKGIIIQENNLENKIDNANSNEYLLKEKLNLK